MSTRRRREAVPPGQAVPIELLSVQEGEPLNVRWLSEPRGLLAHWGRERPLACPGEGLCTAAIHRGRTVWKGYASVEYWRPEPYADWAPAILEVTARLGECLAGHDLRGEVWRLVRQPGRGGRHEVTGECIGVLDALALPDADPIEPVVYRVYGTTAIALDVPPYLPPRQIRAPSVGAPPTVAAGSGAAADRQDQSLHDAIRAQLVAGTLPASLRRAMPRLVAGIEAELAAGADRAPAGPASPRPAPAPPPGPGPSPNGRTR